MSWKPTWVLLALALALFAFIVFVEKPLRRQRELDASRIVFRDFNPSSITNIEIHPWSNSLIQFVRNKKNPGAWDIVQPISYPAQKEAVEYFLNTLSTLEWVDRHTPKELLDHPAAQEEFGFTKPQFTILLQGSGPDRRIEIGNRGTFGDRFSMEIVGNNNIYDIDAGLLKYLPATKDYWRDSSLLDVTNLAFNEIHARVAGKEFELELDPTNHLWFANKHAARADTPKIIDLLSNLENVSIALFVSDNPQVDLEPLGLQTSDTSPPLALSFYNGSNKVGGFEAGAVVPRATNYIYARRLGPGNIVVVPRHSFDGWELPFTNFLDLHFISVSPSLVESIKVQGDDNFVVSKETNGQWIIHAKEAFPADPGLMGFWLASLTNIPTSIVKAVVTDFSPYGLSNACLQYAVQFNHSAGSQAEARIDFGTNKTGEVFERREDESFVNSIDPGDFRWLPRVSWQLRDRGIWNFNPSNVTGIAIHQLGATIKLLRIPDGEWTYAPGFNTQIPVNSAGVDECVHRLSDLHAIYWDGVGEDNLEKFGLQKPKFDIEVEVSENGQKQAYKLQFGNRSPMVHPYASVVRDGRRLIFEFPADVYENFVLPYLPLMLNPQTER